MSSRRAFKFRSFTEQISSIKIDIIHRTNPNDDQPENNSYFHEALCKWRELNCTIPFNEFVTKLSHKTNTLVQVVHHKDEILETLKEHLEKKDPLILEPLLDLLVQLARDLQAEFYPHFLDFFSILVSVCNVKDVPIIEKSFNCFAYLFKFLWRQMLSDITNVYKVYSELFLDTQRHHVRRFAVESFGFLLRKVKNLDGLCELMLTSVLRNPKMAEGVGILLFEVCRGIPRQFHSCTEKVLPALLNKFCDSANLYNSENVFQTICKMVERMAEHTNKDFSLSLWKPLLDTCVTLIHDNKDSLTCLNHILYLVSIIVSWRNGSRVTPTILTRTCEILLTIVPISSFSFVSTNYLRLVSSILLLDHTHSECCPLLALIVNNIFKHFECPKEIFQFSYELFTKSYQDYSENILPLTLTYCEQLCSSEALGRNGSEMFNKGSNINGVLTLLTKLCIQQDNAAILQFSNGGSQLLKIFEDILELAINDKDGLWNDGNNTLLSWGVVWATLKCLQNIRPCSLTTPSLCCQLFTNFYSHLHVMEGTQSQLQLLILAQSINTLVGVLDRNQLLNIISIKTLLTITELYSNSLVILEAILTCVRAYESYDDVLTVGHFNQFLSLLKQKLSSPSDNVRLVTLQILNSFPQPFLLPDYDNPSTTDKCDIIETCLKAEETPPTLTAYRNRLVWLSNLKYSPRKFNRLPNIFKEIPLRFLLGMLYVKFSVLWEPISELISSYAVIELKNMFWDVFGETLYNASQATTNVLPTLQLSDFSLCVCVNDVIQGFINNRIVLQTGFADHVTYRVFLWQSMTQFISLAESRSKVIIPLLYNFMETEYGLTDETFQNTQDISSANHIQDEVVTMETEKEVTMKTEEGVTMETEEDATMGDTEEEVMECSKDIQDGDIGPKRINMKQIKQLNKTLIAMLTLMSKFSNPKGLYRHDDLKQLYMRLLMNRNSDIQGLALNCILTYKESFLIPYKENLEQLLDDSTFQEQLLCLSSGSQCCIVKDNHKEAIVPALIRILYGRRRSSSSRSSHSNASRRNVIMRFLGSNGQTEIAEFINLLMSPFCNSICLSSSLVDPKVVIPLKIQQSFLFEINQLLKVINEQIEPYLPSILTTIFNLARHCAQLLSDYRNQVSPCFISSLKSIRQQAINLTTETLDLLPHYDLTSVKDPLLTSLIWPQLFKMPQECTQHPTPLLKLLFVFSKHRQFHYLFSFHFQSPDTQLDSITPSGSTLITPSDSTYMIPSDSAPITPSDSTPFTLSESAPIFFYTLLCLKNTKTTKIVTNTIFEIVLNLMIDDSCHSDDHSDNSHECDTEGLKILRPFLTLILEHISESVRKRKTKVVSGSSSDSLGLEFEVLSRITSISSNEKYSDILIDLLLPFLIRTSVQNSQWRDTEKILMTIYNLIPAASKPSSCYRILSKLFQNLKQRTTRDLLCDVYTRLAEKDSSLSETLSIIKKVNSWDPNQLDEPDYMLRQDGFTEAKQLLLRLHDGHYQMKSILPILHNSLYSVLESNDISIRDVAASFVSFVIDNVSMEDSDIFETLILATIVPSIIKGVRSKRETTIYECVDLLGQLVRVYSTHSKFSDMTILTNMDPEVDFFKNIRHIQLHRRTKAFRFLSQICSKDELSQYSLTSFLLPLASHVIFSPIADREHNLVLEAVNVIGGIASRLKWTNYCFLLRHYLRQLPKQMDAHKNIIRVTVAILDNFHFEVSEPSHDSQSHMGGTLNQIAKKDNDDVMELEGTEMEQVDEQNIKGRLLSERIYTTIMRQIIPNLESSLTTSCEVPAHKLSKREDVAVSEKVRVPIAMATTKLLLHLPTSSLHTKLPSILLKVCNTLKSRLNDVREAARDTLLKMAQSLGSPFIHYILHEMIATLTRGYQLHVLSFGLHHLLHGMISKLNPGDLDSSLHNLLSVLMNDLFGTPAEEREIKDIVTKTPESKVCKSVLTFGLVARFLSPSLIPKLLKPIKEMLETRTTSKVAMKIEDIYKKVAIGIQRNKSFSPKLLLMFVHEILSETVQDVKPKTRKTVNQTPSFRPIDSRLLPATPTRSNPPSLAKQSNIAVHLVTQFGLQLFKMALKKGKFKETSPKEHLEMLDPFVSILSDEVLATSQHNKLLSKALNCLMIMLPLPLPSLKRCLTNIITQLFTILRHFSYSGSVVSSVSQDLVAMAFKCMTVILRDFTHSTISDDELKLLVSYIEQDIHDYKRQSTAFPLLKVILGRRFSVDEMNDLMYKIGELSVRGDTSRVRTNSRNALVQYLLNYPLGKKINRHLDFFVGNLSYEEQSGRESVIETLGLVFNKFPQKLLVENATYFLIPISSQLINEESTLCKQMLAEMLKILCKRVTKEKRNEIALIYRDWLAQDNIVHKRLAAQLVGFLVDVEEKDFEKRLVIFIPLLLKCLDKEHHHDDDDVMEEDIEPSVVSLTDHLLFNTLVTIEKIYTICGINGGGKGQLNEQYDQIWDRVQYYLLYPHSWVRLVSSRLVGLLFGSSDIDEITTALLLPSNNDTSSGTLKKKKVWLRFFVNGGLSKIRKVKQCLMGQLKAQLITEELANQAIKNQVFIAKLLLKLHLQSPPEMAETLDLSIPKTKKHKRTNNTESTDEEDSDNEKDTSLLIAPNDDVIVITLPGQELRHLIYQMDRLTRYEAGHHPKESLKRCCVFKWIAAVAMSMGTEHLSDWLYRLIPPLYKELSNPKKVGGEILYNLAVEVIDIIKGISGKQEFSNAYSQVIVTAQKKLLKRKAQYALEAVVDPERSIKRRWKKSRAKRESKKRAIVEGLDTTVSASKRLKLTMKLKKRRKQ